MLGWILGAIGVACVCKAVGHYEKEIDQKDRKIERLERENEKLRVTINNMSQLLADYDKVNKYAKKMGYVRGAVAFFYYLTENHDERFGHFARFLNKVKYMRNDIAHNGTIYEIDNRFLEHLRICWEICEAYDSLPRGKQLCLN